MKSYLTTITVFILAICFFSTGYATDIKIFYMDSQKILTESVAGKEAFSQLEKLKAEKEKEINKAKDGLKKMDEEINLKGSTMKESAKLELQAKYESEYKSLQRLVKDAQEELRRKEMFLVKPISEEVNTVIDEYGKENAVDLILDRRDPGIIYTSTKLDITDAIIKLFDKKHQSQKGKK